jgi:hypothetical protein
MKALILNNKVVDVKETEFEVHNSMTWVDCDDTVEISYNYDGTNFTPKQSAEDKEANIAEADARENLRQSAKAKLIAGEALTEAEADTLVL